MGRLINLSGGKFGQLTVLQRTPAGKWVCRCTCGNETEVDSYALRIKKTKSCGCLRVVRGKELMFKLRKEGKVNTESARKNIAKAQKLRWQHSLEESEIREAVKLRGDLYYTFPDRPCERGHTSKRHVKDATCRACHNEDSRVYCAKKDKENPARTLFRGAKWRAGEEGCDFSLTLGDVQDVWPKDNKCPILGMILEKGIGQHQPQSPSLDRIDPTKGYVRGNIWVISYRANAIKQNVTDPIVFERMAAWLRDSKENIPVDCQRFGVHKMLERAKLSAKQSGVPCTITIKDIKSIWPAECPILMSPFDNKKEKGPSPLSPSLDRHIPKLGYISGNISIISHQANTIKNNETDPSVFDRMAYCMRLKNELSI